MSKVQSILASIGIKSSVKAAKVVNSTVATVKQPVAKTFTKGAEAMANQGRAMVHYQAPSKDAIKMENPKSLKATSGWGGGGYDTNPGSGGGLPWDKYGM